MTSTGSDYLAHVARLVGELPERQADELSAAARAVADTLVAGGLLHVFGSGHSHMLGLEAFYRAGGLAAVNPILLDSLMLHANAVLSTTLERSERLGRGILDDLDPAPHDTLLVASNSGGNRIALDLARAARERGMTVIAIVSVAHARSGSALFAGAENLLDTADIVIDNRGEPGDAAQHVAGVREPMGPTSTAVGAAIMNAIALDAARLAAADGWTPEVFASSNVAGGDAHNAATIARYRGRVRSL